MTDIDPLMKSALSALQEARKTLTDEIRHYPTPISGCDAQFNHLLAERARATRAIEALRRDIHIPTPRMP